jgi:3-deoxy-manno-octulosonate cytidylyltransferase (CMP-KDO synthetase)
VSSACWSRRTTRAFATRCDGFGGDVVMTARSSHRHRSHRRRARTLDAEVIVNVQGDLPLLDPTMVGAALAPLLADAGLPMATISTAISSRAATRPIPTFQVVTTLHDDYALYFSRRPMPYHRDGAAPGSARLQAHQGSMSTGADFCLTCAGSSRRR